MTSRRILGRIDEHMARGNSLMDEIRAEIALHRAESERVRVELERNRAESERNRAHLEDQLRLTRQEAAESRRAWQEGSERLATVAREFSAEFTRVIGEVGEALRDLREESRAHTAAIFELLDRLDGGASPAAG